VSKALARKMALVETDAVLSLSDIEDLAWWASEEHQLVKNGWTFEWDCAVRHAGSCSLARKRITPSRTLFAIESNHHSALDTIMHEVAHALAGSRAGHGPTWKRVATQVGARPERCCSLDSPPHRVIGTCVRGSIHGRTRSPRSGARYGCRICQAEIKWTLRVD
jgi:predicted SprT family Zn-dependent metalloprotease